MRLAAKNLARAQVVFSAGNSNHQTPRSIPFALQPKVHAELERLVKAGVTEPVQFSDWTAPIVPVMKPNGSVHICGDYKVTVNQVAKTDSYPIPRIDDRVHLKL